MNNPVSAPREADEITAELLERVLEEVLSPEFEFHVDWDTVWDRMEKEPLRDGSRLDLGEEDSPLKYSLSVKAKEVWENYWSAVDERKHQEIEARIGPIAEKIGKIIGWGIEIVVLALILWALTRL